MMTTTMASKHLVISILLNRRTNKFSMGTNEWKELLQLLMVLIPSSNCCCFAAELKPNQWTTSTQLIHITRKVWKCNWFLFYSCIIIMGDKYSFQCYKSNLFCDIHSSSPLQVGPYFNVSVKWSVKVRYNLRRMNNILMRMHHSLCSNVVCRFIDADDYEFHQVS